MRPLKLTLDYFGPYEHETVDFTQFNETPLFLITGTTGSGKTTLFDAMCYALFGKTSNDQRDARLLRSDFAPDAEDTWVSFWFEHQGVEYQVKRRVPRLIPGQKSERPTKVSLIYPLQAPEPTEITKVGEVNQTIEQLLHLQVDQFRQIILLPQGKFREFLASSSKDKTEILRTLFGTQLYQRWADRLNQDLKQLEQQQTEATTKMLTLRRQLAVVDDEQPLTAWQTAVAARITAMQAEQTQRQAKLQTTQALVTKWTQQVQAWEKWQQHHEQLEKISQEIKALRLQEPAMKAQQTTIKLLEWVQQQSSLLTQVQQLTQQITKWETQLRTAKQAAKQSQAELATLQAKLATYDDLEQTQRQVTLQQAQAAKLAPRWEQLQQVQTKQTQLERQVAQSQQALTTATTALAQAEASWRQLDDQYVRGQIAQLAQRLAPDSPCPVCGSCDHPHPAVTTAGETISESELKQAQATRDQAKMTQAQAQATLTTQHQQLQEQQRQQEQLTAFLQQELATQSDVAEAYQAFVAKVASDQTKLQQRQAEAEQVKTAVQQATQILTQAQTQQQTLQEQLTQAQAELGTQQATLQHRLASEQPTLTLPELMERATEVVKLPALRQQVQTFQTKLTAATERYDLLTEQTVIKPSEDQEYVQQALMQAQAQQQELYTAVGKVDEVIEHWQSISNQVAELAQTYAQTDQQHRQLYDLVTVMRGKGTTKLSFERFVLQQFFGEVLQVASQRLLQLTDGRYYFELDQSLGGVESKVGLEVNVFDEHAGKLRSVHTLSGGESFMASLSLALALGEVVQQREGSVKIEALFVDEGFGSLDQTALEQALASLQAINGQRMVGIISHVSELKAQIPDQLVVTAQHGRSTISYRHQS
ncbi:MAG: SMC family ATPase [Limosilactobacillus sp.]|nr:SMC family ATPase [Limosilactobacillus sp.]